MDKFPIYGILSVVIPGFILITSLSHIFIGDILLLKDSIDFSDLSIVIILSTVSGLFIHYMIDTLKRYKWFKVLIFNCIDEIYESDNFLTDYPEIKSKLLEFFITDSQITVKKTKNLDIPFIFLIMHIIISKSMTKLII